MKRYFEFVNDASSKFWEVWVDNTCLCVRFGKIGTNGQTTIKDLPSATAAEDARDKAIAQKIKKGYLEGSSNA